MFKKIIINDEFGLVNRKWEELTKVFRGRGMCAKGGNSVCLAVNCSEGQPKFKMFKKRIICRNDEFGLGNRMWEELTKNFRGRGMCAKGGNSVCLAVNCSEGSQIQNRTR